jgi:hypothetical protein
MKLRIRSNSIRLRLSQSEVAQFQTTGAVEESIEFGLSEDNKLIYRLISAVNKTIEAEFVHGQITVFVPQALALEWTTTNRIGLGNKQEIGEERTLKILIEKDFSCVERRDGEDDSDAFPYPNEKGKPC